MKDYDEVVREMAFQFWADNFRNSVTDSPWAEMIEGSD